MIPLAHLWDEVCDVSNVNAELHVAVGEGLDEQGILDFSAAVGIYAHHRVRTPKVKPVHITWVGTFSEVAWQHF